MLICYFVVSEGSIFLFGLFDFVFIDEGESGGSMEGVGVGVVDVGFWVEFCVFGDIFELIFHWKYVS